MKMLAVLVIVWTNVPGAISSQQIEMPTMASCRAAKAAMAADLPKALPPGFAVWAFCVERK